MKDIVLIVIPARGGSKGIIRKNLRKVHGISLTEWAIRSAIEISKRHPATISLSSDDATILSIADEYSDVMASRRPLDLSTDFVPDYQVLRHELRLAEENIGEEIHTTLLLQPTSPVRELVHLEQAIRLVKNKTFSAVWSISEVPIKFHPRKQLQIKADELCLSVESPLVIARQELKPTYIRNGVCYAFSRSVILSDETLMGSNCGYIKVNSETFNVDDLSDLQNLRSRTTVDDGKLILKEVK